MTQTTTSHVLPLTSSGAPEAAQPILEKIEKKFGKSMNIFNTMAYQPQVLEGVTTINNGLQNDLPETYRELAYCKASHLNDCGYCSHYHEQAAKQAGVSEEQLAAIGSYATSDKFDDKEKAILKYAEQLTTDADVDVETVAAVKAFLDDTQLVTLASAVALANFTNRFNHGLGIQLP